LLTLLTGVAAHGLLVYAQKTVQIGTIGISQVVQPALAVTWSFLLLDEHLVSGQVLGIGVAMGGLLAFSLYNRPREQVAASEVTAPAFRPTR
jgi:drug/metabolite transporter (DMT)-like permease